MTGDYDHSHARSTDPLTSLKGTLGINPTHLVILVAFTAANIRPGGWTNGELSEVPGIGMTYAQIHKRMPDVQDQLGLVDWVRDPDGVIVERYWPQTNMPQSARQFVTNRPLGSVEVLEKMTPEEKIAQVYADYEQLEVLNPLRGGRGKKKRCPLVPHSGPLDTPVMIIGEAPGEEEVKQLRPFVGPSGKLLNRLMNQAGFPRQLCYVTNVILYRPPENRTPLVFEIAVSRRRLMTEIWAVGPQLIITLGATALRAVRPKAEAKVSDIHGQLEHVTLEWPRDDPTQPLHQHDCKLLPTFHPAAALRDRNIMGKMQADLSVLTRMMEAARDRGDPG